MLELNSMNGADKITHRICASLKAEAKDHLYGCEMGIAWGGGVEAIGKI